MKNVKFENEGIVNRLVIGTLDVVTRRDGMFLFDDFVKASRQILQRMESEGLKISDEDRIELLEAADLDFKDRIAMCNQGLSNPS